MSTNLVMNFGHEIKIEDSKTIVLDLKNSEIIIQVMVEID
jgi:hypothetical protein